MRRKALVGVMNVQGSSGGIEQKAKITYFIFHLILQLKKIKTFQKMRLKAEMLYFFKISNYLSNLLNYLSNI